MNPTRRAFLATSAAALVPNILRPGAATPTRIKLGIIKTGGRGAWIGDLTRS